VLQPVADLELHREKGKRSAMKRIGKQVKSTHVLLHDAGLLVVLRGREKGWSATALGESFERWTHLVVDEEEEEVVVVVAQGVLVGCSVVELRQRRMCCQ
jgi:hypothetical protein